MHPEATRLLRDTFQIETLYPIQNDVINRLLSGGSALVVLPTGSGKSLCYQLPGLVLRGRGVTLVFSPLIALMEDQVAALRAKGVRAEYINSTLRREQREARYRALGRGEYDLIYATPERMYKPEFVAALEAVEGGIALLAIDEAHCITKWGHDFRPAYQEVGRFRRELGSPMTVALTATATPEVREDIRSTLGLDRDELPLFATGIDRPNLALETREVWDIDEKLGAITEIALESGGCGIVYFTLIKTLEEYATELRRRLPGTPMEIYHGKLHPAEKKRVYDRFSAATPKDGLVLLATNAFGMGVDKSDIRFIVHAQVPGSVEAYYQEVGRAGRDGDPSRCVLLYLQEDLVIQQQFIEWLNPSPDLLLDASHVFERSSHADLDVDEVREAITGRNRGDRRAEHCLVVLEKIGAIEATAGTDRYRYVRSLRTEELDLDELAEKKERDLRRLLRMVELVRGNDIHEFVREYFQLR